MPIERTVRFVLFFIAMVACGAALAQQPSPMKDAALTRTFDAVRNALEAAQLDAGENDAPGLTQTLKKANELWQEAAQKYLDAPTADAQWKPNFDTITDSLLKAGTELSRGSTASAVKTHIDTAASTLAALRMRNGVPDLRAALHEVNDSMDEMKTVVSDLRGKNVSPEQLAQLQGSLAQATARWSQFTEAVVDVNALGLDEKKLARLRDLVELQDKMFARLNNALATENRRELVSLLSQQDRPILGLMLLVGGQDERK